MAATPTNTPPVTRVLLARHGEVDPRHRGTIYGRLDVELSPDGLEQSRTLAASLAGVPLDAVISSGLRRAEAAAALVRSGRDLARVDDERLLEMDRGGWAGMPLAELAASDPEGYGEWVARRGALAGPDGESPADVAARVIPALAEHAAAHPGGCILVVAHMWVVRSAVCHALEVPMERSPAVALQPGGLVALDWPLAAGAKPALASLGMTRP